MDNLRKGQKIQNETMVLDSQDGIMRSVVSNCMIRIVYPPEVTIYCSTFTNTTIEVAKTCKKIWTGCYFDSCVFKGRYYDTNFGMADNECDNKPGLRNCDFTAAKLHMCAFFNSTPADLRMPGWPHVTIFNPAQNAEDFKSLETDALLASIQDLMTIGGSRVAKVYNLPQYLRESREELFKAWEFQTFIARIRKEPPPPEPTFDIERSRQLLATKPYVYM